jgi:uncharacterized Fe-S center protein
VNLASTVYRSDVPDLLTNIGKHLDASASGLRKYDAVAIKLHMGEEGNARYLRPAVVRTIADWVKARGAEPFVTDSTSLYRRKRGTLFDYLRTAAGNGFTSESMGCPVLIADGIKSNGIVVELKNHLKLGKVGVAPLIHEADGLICLSHLTLHPDVLPSAALKNLAMGCTDKEAKMRMHASDAKPTFDRDKCTGCGTCVRHCPTEALELESKKVKFNPGECVSCAECIAFCEYGAVRVNWSSLSKDVCLGVVDAVTAVLSTFRPESRIFMNLGYDVTEDCDCGGGSKLPVVTDLGVLSSQDPVAVDHASAQALNQQPTYPGGAFADLPGQDDRMSAAKPSVDWRAFLALASERGLGETTYETRVI